MRVSGRMFEVGDLRHGHGEAFDGDMSVEGLEDVARHQRVIYPRVFVLVELGQIALPDIHHIGGGVGQGVG